MAEKHLRELLKEDQEPFLLKHYISERRSQLKKTPSPDPNTTLSQLKKKNSNLPLNKCFQNATKSPLLLLSPKKSPLIRPSNAKTASLLLEAALRIHNKNVKPKPKPNRALGLFGSLLKKLTSRRKKEALEGVVNKVKDSDEVVGFTCSSSAVWSDKSLDLESSTTNSAHSFDEEIQFLNKRKQNHDHDHDHAFFCESPFRFSLQRSPDYSGRYTPEFSSPAASPCRRKTEDKEINGADGVNKFQSGEESEEEDKEQCSPVSVLDPPFDDDDDGHENDHGDDGFDLECSYANVQRTKQHLLDRLRRFEKLAELDPVELEKRMLDQEDIEYETFIEEDDDYEDDVVVVVDGETIPEELKRLVYDLINEEETEVECSEERNMVIRRVLRRLELWKEVESNTIDMMIDEDFSREEGRWKKNDEHTTRELAVEIELGIFSFLVDELSEELVC